MVSKKLTEAVTVHLSPSLSEAIKNVSFQKGITPSEWFRELASEDLKNQYLQAKSTLATLAVLGNDENFENAGNFEGEDDEIQ